MGNIEKSKNRSFESVSWDVLKLFSLTAFLVCLECYLSLWANKIDRNPVAQSLLDKKTDHQAFKIKEHEDPRLEKE